MHYSHFTFFFPSCFGRDIHICCLEVDKLLTNINFCYTGTTEKKGPQCLTQTARLLFLGMMLHTKRRRWSWLKDWYVLCLWISFYASDVHFWQLIIPLIVWYIWKTHDNSPLFFLVGGAHQGWIATYLEIRNHIYVTIWTIFYVTTYQSILKPINTFLKYLVS